MRNYNPNSTLYFFNLRRRGYKRWQIQSMLNKKPKWIPEALWVRLLRRLLDFA